MLHQLGEANPVHASPRVGRPVSVGKGAFLDFPGSALQPGCIYETDFKRYANGRPATVYAHIVQQEGRPDRLALQYWFYWYSNDWNNKYESDWEGIQLLFEASSIDQGSDKVLL